MAKLISEIIIKHETRQCIVKGRQAMFHQWAEKSKMIGSSPLAGGHPGGAIKQTVGIIEYIEDGTVHECYPNEIRFLDTTGKAMRYCWDDEAKESQGE